MLFLHDRTLREYGGLQGIGSEDLLHGALGRPVNRLSYGDPEGLDLFDLTAGCAYGLACDHPFIGNERTGWGCCVLFLKANGRELEVPAPEVVERMVLLASGRSDEPAFAAWLRQRAI